MAMRQLKIQPSITTRGSRSIEKYLREVSNTEPLSPEREVELAMAIEDGDKEALSELVTANLRFAISVAKQYQSTGIPLEDLIAEANVGLIQAAGKFDHSRGFKFISYAVWWIRQSILKYIAENKRVIRMPVNRSAEMRQMNKARETLEQQLERPPTMSEIAVEIGMDENKAYRIYKSINDSQTKSLSIKLNNEDGASELCDVLENKLAESADKLAEEGESSEAIQLILSTLKPLEARIITLYFGLGKREPQSLEGISEEINLTKERIRQIKDKAIKLMRNGKRQKKLRSLL